MNCGTFQPVFGAGAARPRVDAGSGLFLGTFAGIGMSAPTSQAITKQACMKVWNVRTAYMVAHTDRPTTRPLERSP